MRKALFASVVVAALAYAAPATAGCWATAQLAAPPAGTSTGKTWTANITVLQHGAYPLPDAAEARPTVTISKNGERKTFTAKPVDTSKGTYEASVVFPSGGTWTYAVYDDFTTMNGEEVPCDRTHELGTARISGPASPGSSTTEAGGFPVWPVTGGFGAALLVAGGAIFLGRRSRRTAVA